ncbi:hypothetical protein ACP70R_015211 [Stipagrostis hirtigluma subsp. patula]
MAPPRQQAELMDELVAEILVRVPPDEPAHLVRAALVSKAWRRLLSDPAFLRRYRSFHRAPPLLGFLHNHYTGGAGSVPSFIPTAPASPFPQRVFGHANWTALDCRHGRVLFHISGGWLNLIVWDPITGDRHALPEPSVPCGGCYNAAVLCAVRGCDHLDCHGGPFVVVLAGNGSTGRFLQALVYSSEAGAWNASAYLGPGYYLTCKPSAVIRDDIFFVLVPWDTILRYNLGKNCLSIIHPPEAHEYEGGVALMPVEDGSLGLASVKWSRLCLWSRNADTQEVSGWVKCRAIGLDRLIPFMLHRGAEFVGSAGFGITLWSQMLVSSRLSSTQDRRGR